MNTRSQLHQHRRILVVPSLLLGVLSCQVETVDLRGISSAAGRGANGLGGDVLASGGPRELVPVDPEPTLRPRLTTPSDTTPSDTPPKATPPIDITSVTPDLGLYQPLPDAGVDLSPPAPGCRNLDFLFVVDNSASMIDEQDNLARSFGDFMQVVESTLGAQDYHIMVVDTDDRGIGGLGGSLVSPSSCNGVFGAGRRQTSSGQDCGIAGSASFMTRAQTDLEGTFSCAAQVGTFGDVLEQPMTALLSAVGSSLNAPGGCNEGFSRDDAILVVTFVTDEDDTRSPGAPAEWRQQLIDAKGGNEEAVVVLGLVGDNNIESGLEGGPCGLLDANPAPRLQQFVQSLTHGSLGSVCAADYSPFLTRAVPVIHQACDSFSPPSR
jgi:hypothetical protein